jgi:DNA-nicking Smr family endonuclease
MVADDDRRLFREAVRDVKRLRSDKQRLHPPKPRARARFARLDELEVLRESLELGPGDLLVETAEELRFKRAGVSDALLRKLRRGQFRVEAELDLHGMTVAQARNALREFMEGMVRANTRCVRIVHGKGRGSGNRGPVVKQAVNAMLQRMHAVVAFTSARPMDGGTGALYVLLGRAGD